MLKNYDIRAFIDSRSEKTGKKIRDAEIKKVPYMIIIGEKEEKSTIKVKIAKKVKNVNLEFIVGGSMLIRSKEILNEIAL